MALGQLTHLPEEMAANPFHPLLARFSRLKAGSFELLFQIESWLVRYSWLGLVVLAALVWMPLEEIDVVSTCVRLATLLYPCLFIWSLTRLSGVELMQLMLEGQWTADLLATPLDNRALTVGFASPIWITIRQYFLISLFSLVLYGLESYVIVYQESTGRWLGIDVLARLTLFNIGMFFSGIAWIVFLYMARLYGEVRLRNGLLKGLMTLLLLLAGLTLLAAFLLLLTRYYYRMDDTLTLIGLGAIAAGLLAVAGLLHVRLSRHFRRYLMGQIDIDLLVFDVADPQATAWQKV